MKVAEDARVSLKAVRGNCGALDDPGFEALFLAHGPAVHAYFARRQPEIADDLFSDVWLAAYTKRSSFDPHRGDFLSWIFGIARHALQDAQRKRARALRLRAQFGHLFASRETDPWEAVDNRLVARGLGGALAQALQQITFLEREVLLLVVWEELTPAQAAKVLDIPQGTARSRLHNARKALQGILAVPHSETELPSTDRTR